MAIQWKEKVKAYIKSGLTVMRHVKILSRGQLSSDVVLQLAHRLEKGLTSAKPKAMRGWDKAVELEQLLEKKPDVFAYETGVGVLYAYLDARESAFPDERKRAELMKAELGEKGIIRCKNSVGGAVDIAFEDIRLTLEEFAIVQKLFETRHSVRDFADTEVSNGKILQAVQLANRCPSACNRQPYRIYVMSAKNREQLGYSNEFGADKFILVTGRISAFKISELNDWIVSASIFAGYLALALHAFGIGSCIMRKDLTKESGYNANMRKLCKIPQDEQIILELAVGEYKEHFLAPVSRRMTAEDIVNFVVPEKEI